MLLRFTSWQFVLTTVVLANISLFWYEILLVIGIFIWSCYASWKLALYIDELEIYRNTGLKLTISKEEELEKAKQEIKKLKIEIRRLK